MKPLPPTTITRIADAIQQGGLLFQSESGDIVYANAYIEKLLGYSVSELEDMTITALFLAQLPPLIDPVDVAACALEKGEIRLQGAQEQPELPTD